MDAGTLYSIISSPSSTLEDKTTAVSTVKAQVKRSFVEIESSYRYFEALSLAIASPDYVLQAMSFSCLCYLVKRVIIQKPEALREPSSLALPIIISKLGDAKSTVRSTASRVFEDYWMACPAETEQILRDTGLGHPNTLVRSECLHVLTRRIQLQEGKFAFRPFTPIIVGLLSDEDNTVQHAAYELLVLFFGPAHAKAKQDLNRELVKQTVDAKTANGILRSIGIDTADPPKSSLTSAISSNRPASASSFRPLVRKPPSGAHTAPLRSTSSGSDADRTSTVPSQSAIFSTSFITESSDYREEYVDPENVSYVDMFRPDIESMLPAFEGKENEHNWSSREKHIQKLRGIIRGNIVQEDTESVIWMFKILSDGITKAMSSLRTSLAVNGCKLIKEATLLLGHLMDSNIEPYLSTLVKITSGAKKLTAQIAASIVNVMIINTALSSKYLSHIQIVMNEKIQPPKAYAAVWLRLFICCHHKHKSQLESMGAEAIMEKCIVQGLNEANPSVREAMRVTFWTYHAVWTRRADTLLGKLDSTTRRNLERANVHPITAISAPSSAPLPGFKPKGVHRAPPIREFIAKSRKESMQRAGLDADSLVLPHLSSEPPVSTTSSEQPVRASSFEVPKYHSRRDFAQSSVESTATRHTADSEKELKTTEVTGSTIVERGKSSSPEVPSKEFVSIEADIQVEREKDAQETEGGVPEEEPEQQEEPEEEKALVEENAPESAAPIIFPSLSELIISESAQEFTEGLEIISYCLQGDEVPDKYNCARPITLPSPGDVSKTIRKVFSEKGEDGSYKYSQVIDLYCTDSMVENTYQFVGAKPIIIGAYSSLEEDRVVAILGSLKQMFLPAPQEGFEALTELISYATSSDGLSKYTALRAGINLACDISHGLSANSELVEQCYAIERAASVLEEWGYDDLFDILVRLLGAMRDDYRGEINLEFGLEALKESERKQDDLAAEAESLAEEIEVVSDEISVVQNMVEDDDSQSTENEMVSIIEPSRIELSEEVEDVDVRGDSGTNDRDKSSILNHDESRAVQETPEKLVQDEQSIAEENTEENAEENAEGVSSALNTSSMSELQDQVGSKLAIFEDPEESVSTPKKTHNIGFEPQPSWYGFEVKKENCLSPLPQKDTEATQLFDRLLSQLENKSLDSHGFRKLVTIVKGSKLRYIDSPAYAVWNRERRLHQLQAYLLEYLKSTDLTENQMNLGLLQLSQLLSLEGEAFYGLEKKVLNSLVTIRAATESSLIGFGALAETRDSLVELSLQNQSSRSNLLDGLLEKMSEPRSNKEVKILLISTLAKVLDPTFMDGVEMESRLAEGSISPVIHAYMGDKEVEVRRATYSALSNLRQVCSSDIKACEILESEIMSKMSSGQRQLADHMYQQQQ